MRLASFLVRALLVGLWMVALIAGAMMVLGGVGLAGCGLGFDLAGCSHGMAEWTELPLGVGAIVLGLVVVYGFGASLLEELAAALDRRR